VSRTRRFSQAISQGEGISIIVDVADAQSARAAEEQGAEALTIRGLQAGVREATALPIFWRGHGNISEAQTWGADACLLSMERLADDEGALEREAAEAARLGLDCVVEVRNEEELEDALERIDPEIFLLSARGTNAHGLAWALELLPDVPAGKLAVAEGHVSTRDEIVELERAGVDAVIVGARDIAELVPAAPLEV
jgi:indole-3-glycerol phosphate synthase